MQIKKWKEEFSPEFADWILLKRSMLLELALDRMESISPRPYDYYKTVGSITKEIREVHSALGITRQQVIKEAKNKSGEEILQEAIELHKKYKEEHPGEYVAYCPLCRGIISTNRNNATLPKEFLKHFEQGIKPEQTTIHVVKEDDLIVTEKDYKEVILETSEEDDIFNNEDVTE
jgi:hypothetical protein